MIPLLIMMEYYRRPLSNVKKSSQAAQRTLENMLKTLKSEVQTLRILPAAEFERQMNDCPDSGQGVISDR